MEITYKVHRINHDKNKPETVSGTVELEGYEGHESNPAQYLQNTINRITPAFAAELLHNAIRQSYKDEITRLLKGGRRGVNQLEQEDLPVVLSTFIPGTDMEQVEKERKLRAKAEAKAAQLRKQLDALPADIKDLVLHDVEG